MLLYGSKPPEAPEGNLIKGSEGIALTQFLGSILLVFCPVWREDGPENLSDLS